MFQYVLIGLLGLSAVGYLGWLVFKSFTSTECESGCGKCGTLDVKAIQKSIEKKKATV